MLAVAGGKGGVGKTTTVLGLAAALPGRPLAVDTDVDMPDLHRLAGLSREPGLDALQRENSVDAVAQPTETYDCRVVPAPDSAHERADRLLERLGSLTARDETDSVLVDTPAGASVDAAAPLRAVDGVVLVSTACEPALRDAAKTASMARTVGTPVVGVLLTRTLVRPPGVEELLGCPVLGTVPDERERPLARRRVRDRYAVAAKRLSAETTGADIHVS